MPVLSYVHQRFMKHFQYLLLDYAENKELCCGLCQVN